MEWPRAALEALPVAVVIVDDEGRFSSVNARARELIGAEAAEPAPGVLEQLLERARMQGSPVPGTVDFPAADGSKMVVSVLAAPFPGGVICALEDLSDRARQERADREFITNAAHQLRTPITAIASSIEVLQAGAKEEAGTRDAFLTHIEAQTRRLVRLTLAMLALARAERGDMVAKLEVVPLLPLLEALAEEAANTSSVDVLVDCPPDVAVHADVPLLGEALANLLGNALEHARGTGVRVSASRAHDGVVIEIVDAGPGISESELARVFERFHQGPEERTGAGLGLPIAKAAIEAFGGSIELESREGAGTTARVRLEAA